MCNPSYLKTMYMNEIMLCWRVFSNIEYSPEK